MSETPATLPRDLLTKYFGDDPRLVAAFEDQALAVQNTVEASAAAVDATSELQDATVLTLSPNATLANERVLRLGPSLRSVDDGTHFDVHVRGLTVDGPHEIKLVPSGDATFFLPLSGTLVTREAPRFTNLGDYASDAAAATGGVPVGGVYHTSGQLRVRLV